MNTHTHTHTPEKWEVLKADRSGCNESEGKDMAGCLASGDKVIAYFPTLSAMGNANLIAAAPDMLEALRLLLDQYDSFDEFTMGGGLTNEPFLMARAAVAKAEGGDA